MKTRKVQAIRISKTNLSLSTLQQSDLMLGARQDTFNLTKTIPIPKGKRTTKFPAREREEEKAAISERLCESLKFHTLGIIYNT